MSGSAIIDFDAAIVGAGPTGLSAAIVLGRCRRRVIVFDHGKPRNYAAHAVHCYLAAEGIAPLDLRAKGRNQAKSYGVEFVDAEVTAARCLSSGNGGRLGGFELCTAERSFTARTVLLATGVVDEIADIPNISEFYGRSVHHCPYCDGWEHRDQRLVAFGNGNAAAKLAASLRTWSAQVTACSNGEPISTTNRELLAKQGIAHREEKINRLVGENGALAEVHFETGPAVGCDALFFSAEKGQRSRLPDLLGCKMDHHDFVETGKKQTSGIDGLYLAGDADGDVQFAIVAAAEGAIAATAINSALQEDEQCSATRATRR